ncbi:hypothetical protein CYMTET_54807 [Cymbomonas tetramitiformis]|uniref:EF-hand domain-containing protein n=1 Tax=Cymbomonas tetramitiformis TaxID=36881 RepID=A0AAE0EP72_9CHLO|nr:hypothetical protein CYMTET_54807 [Cymbomonas tetramitiformis]
MVRILKVKARVGINGDKEADKAAKQACGDGEYVQPWDTEERIMVWAVAKDQDGAKYRLKGKNAETGEQEMQALREMEEMTDAGMEEHGTQDEEETILLEMMGHPETEEATAGREREQRYQRVRREEEIRAQLLDPRPGVQLDEPCERHKEDATRRMSVPLPQKTQRTEGWLNTQTKHLENDKLINKLSIELWKTATYAERRMILKKQAANQLSDMRWVRTLHTEFALRCEGHKGNISIKDSAQSQHAMFSLTRVEALDVFKVMGFDKVFGQKLCEVIINMLASHQLTAEIQPSDDTIPYFEITRFLILLISQTIPDDEIDGLCSERFFYSVDTDRDGELSVDELAEVFGQLFLFDFIRFMPHVGQERFKQVVVKPMHALLLAAAPGDQEMERMCSERFFDGLDRDVDGIISLDELAENFENLFVIGLQTKNLVSDQDVQQKVVPVKHGTHRKGPKNDSLKQVVVKPMHTLILAAAPGDQVTYAHYK